MSDDGEVVIPAIYDSLDVNAFKNTLVTKVIIPDTISVISDSAFENTHYLEEVLLPATITTI